jgi:hypothetical protein
MIKKTISAARERYDAPVCEELNVRIEQSILSNTPSDEEYNDQGEY